MRFTFSWLKEHLETQASLNEILEKLTSLGLVVDKVENKAEALTSFTICQIEEAERHPNADRLQVCRVNTGSEILQIVCGAPNARKGLKAVLARPGTVIPATQQVLKVGQVRGVESFGMMCSSRELLLGEDEAGIIEVPDDAPLGESYVKWKGLDDILIEVEITPNRGDCLGVYGIARDLAATGVGTLKPLALPSVEARFPCPITSLEGVPYFTGRVIRGVKNGPSPEWLQRKLLSIGLRPISTLVDITNYFLYDRGRPLHVFDFNKIKGSLRVGLSQGGETFQALDEKTYTLSEDMAIISDDTGVISLAGIMGGISTGCDETTQDVFLESAFFDPIRTAITGRTLGILSDSRYRFERGVDPESTLPGLEAATQMILDLCGGEASEIVVGGVMPNTRTTISFSLDRLRTLGGVSITPLEATQIVTRLGFEVGEGGEPLKVLTPSWRFYMEHEADLVEEVLRVVGYDKIPAAPCGVKAETKALSPLQERRFVVRKRLAGRGLTEAVTWSFLSYKEAQAFDGGNDALKITNPISQDLDTMRPSLLPNLLQAVAYNKSRGQANVAIFEVGPQYAGANPEAQHMMAAAVRAGEFVPSNWCDKARPVDVFDVKGDTYAILALAGIDPQLERSAPSWYHPGRSATLKLGAQVLGYFGELHPRILKERGVTGSAVAFELFIDRLPLSKRKSAAKPKLELSPYQAVERDFAFVVKADVSAETLMKAAKKADPALVERVGIFDVFPLEDGEKSLGLRVRLQPKTATLTDAAIQAYSQAFIALVTQTTGGALRQ